MLLALALAGCAAPRAKQHAVPSPPASALPVPATPPPTLVLAKHRLERRDLGLPPSTDCKKHARWMNVLTFNGFSTEVPLARSEECTHAPVNGSTLPTERAGFDRATLKISWLDPGKLVWVRWSTTFNGTGGYVHAGHVVLAVEGAELVEAFRTNYTSFARSGFAMHDSKDLQIRFDGAASHLVLDQKEDYFEEAMGGDASASSPLAVPLHGGGWVLHLVTEQEWTYTVGAGRLAYVSGRLGVRLDPPGFSADAIAGHFTVDAARIAALNPGHDPASPWTGLVVVRDDLPAYVPELDDGLCGDKPCDGAT
jgi:hypothetical protein